MEKDQPLEAEANHHPKDQVDGNVDKEKEIVLLDPCNVKETNLTANDIDQNTVVISLSDTQPSLNPWKEETHTLILESLPKLPILHQESDSDSSDFADESNMKAKFLSSDDDAPTSGPKSKHEISVKIILFLPSGSPSS